MLPCHKSMKSMWEFEVILNEGSRVRFQSDPIIVAEIPLPHSYQLQIRLVNGFRSKTRRIRMYGQLSSCSWVCSVAQHCYDVLLLNGSVPFPIGISAKLDNSYGQLAALRTELSSDSPPVTLTVGNPLKLFTFDYAPINYFPKLKVILTVHMEKSISVQNHLDQISTLIESGQFADCKVISRDGEEFACHKAILSLKSAVILTAFQVEHMSEAKSGRIQLDCDGVVVKLLLRHFYTGEMPVVPDEFLMELYGVAHLYQIESLKTQLAEVIVSKMNELVTIENVLNTVVFADKYDLKELRRFCLQFGFTNRSEIVKQPEWKDFRSEHLDRFCEEFFNEPKS